MNYQFKIIRKKDQQTRYFIYHATIIHGKKLIGFAFNDSKDYIDFAVMDNIDDVEVVMDIPDPHWYFTVLFQQLFDTAEYQKPIDKLINQYFESFVA